MTTEEDIVKVMRYLVAAWPQYELTEQTVAVYVMQLLRRGYEPDVLLLAAMALVDSSTWFPTVAALHDEAGRIATERTLWFLTANHRDWEEPLPASLCLPEGMARRVFGRELATLSSGEERDV